MVAELAPAGATEASADLFTAHALMSGAHALAVTELKIGVRDRLAR